MPKADYYSPDDISQGQSATGPPLLSLMLKATWDSSGYFISLCLSTSLPTCPSTQSQHLHELLLPELLLCHTHILNLSLPLDYSVSRLFPISSDWGFTLSSWALLIRLHFQATIFTCFLNISCFEQTECHSPGQPCPLGPSWDDSYGWLSHWGHPNSKEIGHLPHSELRMNLWSTNVPRCFSPEQLSR